MKTETYLPTLLTLVVLAGCATPPYNPVAADYNGPTAKVYDSMLNSDKHKGDFCVLSAVDGHEISNSIGETWQRGRGKGLALYPWVSDRRIPAMPVKATIRCETVFAAPILELTGTSYKVFGVVDFRPEVDGRYVVKGIVGDSGCSVWIEEKESARVATEKVALGKC